MFDLKRVSLNILSYHLKKICKIENGKITEEALDIIARAAEGSVRDSISLLDRALIHQSLKPEAALDAQEIRNMLGLVDKSKIINLIQHVLKGDQKSALLHFQKIFQGGLDGKLFLNDILEVLYLFSRRINLGSIEKDLFISENEIDLIESSTKGLNNEDLALFWQITIKTIEDLKTVSNEQLALEMYLLQLIHVKSIEEFDKPESHSSQGTSDPIGQKKIIEEKQLEQNLTNPVKQQLKSIDQIKVLKEKNIDKKNDVQPKFDINSFEDLITISGEEKDAELKYDLERNVKLIRFENGKIDINFNEKLNRNFIKKLSQSLLKWTGKRWIITLSKEDGGKTFFEEKLNANKKILDEEKQSGLYKEISSIFPDIDLIKVEEENE